MGVTTAQINAFVAKHLKLTKTAGEPSRIDPAIISYEKSPATYDFYQDTGKNFVLAPQTGVLTDAEQRAAVTSLLKLHAHHINIAPDMKNGTIYEIFTKSYVACTLSALRNFFGGNKFVTAYCKMSKINVNVKPKETFHDYLEKKKAAEEKRAKTSVKRAREEESDDDDDDDEQSSKKKAAKTGDGSKESKKRNLLFVGNLAYDVTREKLKKLFESCNVIDVRIPLHKTTKQQQGYAFIEFATPQDLYRGLAYHNTMFEGRELNIELTAGGGGNSKARKAKLAAKKAQLQEERYKKAQKEKKTEGSQE